MALTVHPARCPQDHRCPAVRACPAAALRQTGLAAPRVDAERCSDCGLCVTICPTGALRLGRAAATASDPE